MLLLIPGGLAVAGLVLFIILLIPPRPGATGKGVAIAGCVVGSLGLVSALILRNVTWIAVLSSVVGVAVLIAALVRFSRTGRQPPRP